MLQKAQSRFFDRDEHAGDDAIKELWDAFERLKTLEIPQNKRDSADKLADKATPIEEGRELIKSEMKALTEIGNNWRIRHAEVGKISFGGSRDMRDYLFLRLFSLIRLLVRSQDTQG